MRITLSTVDIQFKNMFGEDLALETFDEIEEIQNELRESLTGFNSDLIRIDENSN